MKSGFYSALLGATSVVALATTAFAQAPAANQNVEQVVVTGSLVISDIQNSPTPLTVMTADQLQATTPTDIPDALNKLPELYGSSGQRTINNPSSNAVGNTLNLRNFGAQRTLVLLDGERVTPSNSNGTVDVDVLPQMLMSRVDIVTGGASAVYGSDAITGVVNFILDKNFSGIKYEANSGISTFGDGALYSAGVAMGSDLFGGRGHIEGSLHYFHQDNVPAVNRPLGNDGQAWVRTGQGTTSSPYTYFQYGRETTQGVGGLITCACAANNMQFIAPGVIGAFNPGAPTPDGGVSNGGDGAYDNVGSYQAELRTAESFLRFSYDVSNNLSFYVQGTAAESTNSDTFAPSMSTYAGGYGVSTFFTSNPFLSPAAQALLTSGNPGNTFTLTSITETLGGIGAGAVAAPAYTERSVDRNLAATVGFKGNLFSKFDWNLYYTHGESRQEEDDPHNMNMQKMYAASDAVETPSGNIVCNVSTTAFASLYPGCVPFNVFGEGQVTNTQYNYTHDLTYYVETNTLDDLGANIAGNIFDLPAGPVKAALSGEARWLSLGVKSNSPATAKVDCTGLRICDPTIQLYDDNTVSPMNASENVWEFAGEINVPILANLPLVQSLSVDLAGRVTNYSTSGMVETWKTGLDYHVNDSIRFRGTASVDIRAPTLTDLFQPLTSGGFGYSDPLTGVAGTLPLITQGNKNLQPEVAHTYTVGTVLTPAFLPGLTVSVDYYRIDMENAISALAGYNPPIQALCTSSGGTSPFCSLIVRPISNTSTSPANFPTALISENLNSATQKTEGVDFELDYGFDLADLWETLPGSMNLRSLVSYQPYLTSIPYPGGTPGLGVMPKGRSTSFIQYTVGNWSFNVQNNWLSGFSQQQSPTEVYANRDGAFDTVDATISKKVDFGEGSASIYLSVQNLANVMPPIYEGYNNGGFAGGTYPAAPFENGIGRYFTIGIRGAL